MISTKFYLFEPKKFFSKEERMSIYFTLYREYFSKGIIGRWHVLITLKFLIYRDWQIEYTKSIFS